MIRSTNTVTSCAFYSEALNATVVLHPRRNSRMLRARWNGPEIHVSAPVTATMSQVTEFISNVTPDLERIRPVTPYHDGCRIIFEEGSIHIYKTPGSETYKAATNHDSSSGKYAINISVPESSDFKDLATATYITRIILRRIRPIARQILIDAASATATEIGCTPASWNISSGHRVLGSCDRHRNIRLSVYLLFLPHHLRRYIICHELAHLSEMNHSPAFHRITDAYCDEKEKSLANELKRFKWPVMR